MIVCLVLLCCACATLAQEATVSVGSVTKYSGVENNKSDAADAKSIHNFLNSLEAQVAKAFVEHPEVDYLDRMNTDALFQELHLSSSAAFDPNSGALRNLLGRLDYLIVIDASAASSARVRLIDVRTGAVKAIEICTRRMADAATPACVTPFVNRCVAVAKAKRQMKITAQEQAAAEAAETARSQAEINRQLAELKPTLDDLSTRVRSQLAFWRTISDQLAATGQPLRGSTQSLLDRARTDDRDCHGYWGSSDVDLLHACVGKLRTDVDELETLRKQMQQ